MSSTKEDARSRRILYISYDGILEPLGHSQVFSYLRRLAKRHQITLVTFEKARDWEDRPRRAALQAEVEKAGIRWTALRYHKAPTLVATTYDLAVGLQVCGVLAAARRVEIVHARSYVPAVIGLALKRLLGLRFLFDMRGFWPDQKRDCGDWSQGSSIYRTVKRLERGFLLGADAIVTLTQSAVEVLRARPERVSARIVVIPTCADMDAFRPSARRTGPSGPFVVGCVGSLRVSYLLEEMLEAFKAIRSQRPEARLLILNRGEHEYIRERLGRAAIPIDQVEIKSADRAEVPIEMARMDAGLFFLKAFPSLKGSAPTKLAEFLACGVPCLSNAGIGDFDRIVTDEGVGVIVKEFRPETLRAAGARLLDLATRPEIRDRCVKAARRHFSLDDGVRRYDELYRSL